ncbi:MAG: PTS sugar transporter subunit IIA [Candidatus Omnitrophica bacterium]|nr:PTS sugar transporter subunit IIA [Candidatus Omnitrophota bacterium]
MRITELLSKEAVSVGLASREKDDVLSELVDLLVSSGSVKKSEKSQILKRLQERETLGSTGIGKGVAIPHAKCAKVKKMVAALAVAKEGVDFRSLDGDPTFIFFLLIAPGETPGPHLKALAKISRLLDDKFIRDRLKAADSPGDALRIIRDEEKKTV